MFIPELWSSYYIDAREQELVFSKLVDRRYEDELKFGDTIHVPSRTNLSARTKSANTAITFETQTETNVDITVTTNEYAAIAIEDIARIQTNRYQAEFYAPKMAYALALSIDDTLAGLPDDFTDNATVGALTVDLSYEDFTVAIQELDDALAPMSERHAVVSPAQAQAWKNDDHFTHADYAMIRAQMSESPDHMFVAECLNIPIWQSTNVEGSNAAGHDNTMFHREALCLVMQLNPETKVQYDIDYLAEKIAIQDLWGAREMRDNHGVYMAGA